MFETCFRRAEFRIDLGSRMRLSLGIEISGGPRAIPYQINTVFLSKHDLGWRAGMTSRIHSLSVPATKVKTKVSTEGRI